VPHSKLISDVARTRTTIVITKHGRPVARLVPLDDAEPTSLFGFAKGGITIHGDIFEPLDVVWESTK
jgi:antitoxin (DNA-binding transcriptional repressor) of toxin-antitoxin stability system